MKIRIYIEGGGDRASLRSKCREAFSKLLTRAGFENRLLRLSACGSRNSAFDDFKTAMETAGKDVYPMLLVDSEGPVADDGNPWAHLRTRDNWKKPDGVENDQAQLMVQCMETWCVADRATLREFFGQHLRENALPSEMNLEQRAKADVQEALAKATRECGRDRAYQKGEKSFELVGQLDPAHLLEHLPHFKRFHDMLQRIL